MTDLRISVDTTELDKAIEKAERLRDILKDCKELEELPPAKQSCERCQHCPYKRCVEPIWRYDTWKITCIDRN